MPDAITRPVTVALLPEHAEAVVAVAEFPEHALAVVAVAELPVQLADDPVVFWFRVGKVQFVRVPDAGVPSAGVVKVGEVRVLFVNVCVSLMPTIVDAGAVKDVPQLLLPE